MTQLAVFISRCPDVVKGGANLQGYLGFTETAKHVGSHFVISHSFAYTKFPFFFHWDGRRKVEFRIGEQPERKPVRRNRNEASWLLKWRDAEILKDGPDEFQGVVNTNHSTGSCLSVVI